MTGGQAFARQLAREGVEVVFGLPGDQIMHALDGLYDEPGIRRDHPSRTGHHVPRRRLRARRWAPRCGVRRSGSRRLQRRRGPRHRLGVVVAGAPRRRTDQPARHRRAARAPARGARPARPRAPHHRLAATRAHRRRIRRRCTARSSTCAGVGGGPWRSRCRPRRSRGGRGRAARRRGRRAPARRPGCGHARRRAARRSGAPARVGRWRRRARRRAGGAHRGRRAPAGAGDHHPGGQGRDRRPQPAVGRHHVGEQAPGADHRGRRRDPRGRNAFQATGATKDQVVVHLDVDPTEIGRHFADAVPVVGDAVSTLAALLTELQARSDPRPSRAAETRAMRERVEDELRAIGPAAGMVDPARGSARRRRARPVHDHHGLHVPHALPHLRRAPTCRRRTWARSFAPPPRSVPRSHGPTYRWCASPATAGSSSRQPSCDRGAARHQHRDGRLQRQRSTATPTATSGSASAAARSAPSSTTPTSPSSRSRSAPTACA